MNQPATFLLFQAAPAWLRSRLYPFLEVEIAHDPVDNDQSEAISIRTLVLLSGRWYYSSIQISGYFQSVLILGLFAGCK